MSETPAQEAPAQFFVYYDNSCPICREEIGALKSIDHQNKQVLIDCSDAKFDDVDAAKQTTKAQKCAIDQNSKHS